MVKGFKEFILRGNVVDLAIAVVIGVAFSAVVAAFVGKIVTPILNALPGAKTNGLGFSIRGGENRRPRSSISRGSLTPSSSSC